jgi:hypothetical protein
MSDWAKDLIELKRLAAGGMGALTEKLLHEVAARIIASGLRSELEGC